MSELSTLKAFIREGSSESTGKKADRLDHLLAIKGINWGYHHEGDTDSAFTVYGTADEDLKVE